MGVGAVQRSFRHSRRRTCYDAHCQGVRLLRAPPFQEWVIVSRVHVVPFEIMFKHCDPAGIVFYPRYVEMLNDTIEHWFKHYLNVNFNELHMTRKLGIPVVNLNVDFKAPSTLGEEITKELTVEKLGRTSVGLHIALKEANPPYNLKIAARMTIVFMSLETMQPAEIPADIRERIEAMLQP